MTMTSVPSPKFANKFPRPLTGQGPQKFAANWPTFDSGHPLFIVPESLIRDTSRANGGSGVRGRNVAGLILAVGLISGCDQLFGQDPARCEQSVTTVRQAIGFKDFEAARKWRDYTWKVCDERAIVATLDKEIVDAETAMAAEAQASAEQAAKLAQTRINAAQALWREFDEAKPVDRNEQSLAATRKSAKRLGKGLLPEFSKKLDAYNDAEYQKRLAALSR